MGSTENLIVDHRNLNRNIIKTYIEMCGLCNSTIVMCSTEIRHIWARNQSELVIDNESRYLQLYNDSFLILIGRAKAGLRNFKVCLYENSKRSYCLLKLQVSFGII